MAQNKMAGGVGVAALLLVASAGADIIVYPQSLPRLIQEEFRDMPAKFGDSLPLEGLRGFVVAGFPKNACSTLQPPPTDDNFTGKWIALVSRYECTFEEKVRNAQAANFDAVIVHNVNSSDLEEMSAKNPVGIKIPSVFVGAETGFLLETDYVYTEGFYVVMNGDRPFNINTQLLLPFAIVVGLSLIVMVIFMIVKCIKDRRRARRHRLPYGSLRKIPTCRYGKGDPYDTCAICLDDYAEGDRLRVLPCAHAYHSKCIDPWLTKNRRVCPVCKRRVLAAGERRRQRRHSYSDSEDSSEPLIAPDTPHTEGGTFEVQTENPFVRAARYVRRLGRRRARQPDAPPAEGEEGDENGNPELAAAENASYQQSENPEGSPALSVYGDPAEPVFSRVRNTRADNFTGEGSDERERLLGSSEGSPAATLREESEGQAHRKKKNKRHSRSRSRSQTAERARNIPTEHSINASERDGDSAGSGAGAGQIGVAALPNVQLDGERRNDYVI